MGVPNGLALWEVTVFFRLPGRTVSGGGLVFCWAEMLCVAKHIHNHTHKIIPASGHGHASSYSVLEGTCGHETRTVPWRDMGGGGLWVARALIFPSSEDADKMDVFVEGEASA